MLETTIVQIVRDCNMFQEMFRFEEVPVGAWSRNNKRIDLVALSRLDGEGTVIAVEAKISDWKTALKQAFRNLFSVDLSYIAIPDARVARIDRGIFKEVGIGLLAVDGTVTRVVNPNQSVLTVPEKKQFVIDACKNRLGELYD